jgi:transcriptional regulator with XRE-family HTH domain
MSQTFQQIGITLKNRRGNRGIREVANEIGISSATLSRIENGKLPDLNSFSKICNWLKINPNDFLDCNIPQKTSSQMTSSKSISFHLKADKNIDPKQSTALSEMILHAQSYFDE